MGYIFLFCFLEVFLLQKHEKAKQGKLLLFVRNIENNLTLGQTTVMPETILES